MTGGSLEGGVTHPYDTGSSLVVTQRDPEIVEEHPVANMHTPHHFELHIWELTHTSIALFHNRITHSAHLLSGTEHIMILYIALREPLQTMMQYK